MNDDELHARLEALGSRPVDDPDELVLVGVERRLAAGHAGGSRRRPILWPVLVGVAATVALVVGFVADDPSPAPVDTIGEPGTFGPPPSAEPAPTTPPHRPEDAPDEDQPPPDPTTTTTTTTESEFRSPPESAPPSGDAPQPTDPPPPTDTGPPPTDTGPPPDTRPPPEEPPADDDPRSLRAVVQWRDARAVIAWDGPALDDVATWSIVRDVRMTPSAPETRQRILTDGPRGQRRFVDDPPDRGRVAYVVTGHRADGAVIVRSERLVLER